MSDEDATDPAASETDVDLLSIASDYKVLGRFDSDNGAAVLGRNDADSGTPIGVQGAVPNNATGFGLATPDDAQVEGDLDTTSGHALTVGGNRVLSLGPIRSDGDGYEGGGNVVGGHPVNDATSTVAATIAGGGSRTDANEVSDNYGTIGGGRSNNIGGPDTDPTNGTDATIGGGFGNTIVATYATIGGGRGNAAFGEGSTIGGGKFNNVDTSGRGTVAGGISNAVTAAQATIGGGKQNTASGDYATIAGGQRNEASKFRSTVGGGYNNDATGVRSVVSGGFFNEASGREATVGGGDANEALGDNSTVGGGNGNTASASGATISGGTSNVVNAHRATIGGGRVNVAGSGSTTGLAATVPGGLRNAATGDYSLAAGRQAKATEDGTFVWADAVSGSVTSATSNSFVVAASNGVGLGTANPQAQLHVQDSALGTEASLSKHAAAIQNTKADSSADVLGLQLSNVNQPGGTNNFITFLDDDAVVGAVEGDGGGGVNYSSATADFAEYFPKADPGRSFEDGEVVGLRDGEVVPVDEEVDAALVVSTAPIVTGNRPVGDESEYVDLSLVGQVPVRVGGPVEGGDLLVASPECDGTAVADRTCERRRPTVGIALDGADQSGDDSRDPEVLALVGAPSTDALRDRSSSGGDDVPGADGESRGEDRERRIADLEAENADLREELERKDERIDALEARLAALEARVDGDGDPDPEN